MCVPTFLTDFWQDFTAYEGKYESVILAPILQVLFAVLMKSETIL